MQSLNLARKRIIVIVAITFLLSTWLLVWSVKSITAIGQVESFSSATDITVLNKNTSLPKPGTYNLQKIFFVPQLNVLDTKGNLQPLSKYTKDKITLLTFFYQHCSDLDGCPYAMSVFHNVKNKLEKDKKISESVRFVHISFDPERDTPMMMAGLEKINSGLKKDKKKIDWNFLTTTNVNDLLPVIDAFGQNVDININPMTNSKELSYSHVLKVFLIDKEGSVREIYSTSYMSVDMLFNDVQTLALEYKY